MAIIPLLPTIRIRNVEWTLDTPAQVNRSEWTKRRQVVTQPGPAMWSATADLVVKIGAEAALDVKAFLVNLEGAVNSFRLRAVEAPQFDGPRNVRVDGAGQSGRSLRLFGGNPGDVLRPGHCLTVNDQMVMVMAAATFGADGRATVSFKPSLRYSPANNAQAEVVYPTVLVALTGSSVGWSVAPGRLYQAKQLVLEEVVS